MTGRLPEAFMTQAIACEALGSPLTATLLKLLAARLQPNNPLTVRLFNWPGDMGPDAESVPLRRAGALNSLRILGRCGLEEAYENYDTDPDALWHAVDRALTEEAPFISTFIDSAPQTNDVRRASVLIAVSHWLTQRFKRPLDICEVGASAGLNLMWDKFALYLGENVYGDEDSPVRLAPEWTETVGRAATEDSPLAWFQMEADGQSGSAAMTLRLWPGELRFNMGRVDFHGRWVKWTPPV